jgi:hypothetical protein
MANRVTGDEVKEIISTTLTSVQLAPMITAANLLVTAKCVPAGYSVAELKEIERWLSAHFTSVRDPSKSALVSKSIGEASETYQVSRGSNVSFSLETSPYGQQALILDYMGSLNSLGRQKAVLRGFGADHEDFD